MALFKKKSTKDMVQSGGGSESQAPMEKSQKPKKVKSTRAIGNSRIVIAAICILLAAAVSFVLLPRLYGQRNELTAVVVLAQDVERGTAITGKMLTEEQVIAYNLPKGFLRNKSDAVGKIATEPLYSGEYLWVGRLADANTYQEALTEQSRGLKNGYCLVTIELPASSAGVAGVLRAGDKADVFEYQENTDGLGGYAVSLLMPDMEIYDVLNEKLVSLSAIDELLEAGSDTAAVSTYDVCPTYAVFRCTEDQAMELIRLEKEKALHLVLK